MANLMYFEVPGYEGLYFADADGNIQRDGRTLKPTLNRDGYLHVSLSKGGVVSTRTVHSIVLSTFRGLRPVGLEGRHLNSDQTDNRLVNLQWGTKSANTLDQVAAGTHRNTTKTRCPLDHALSGDNLIPSRLARGLRICRACHCAKLHVKRHPELSLVPVAEHYYTKFGGVTK